MEQNIEVLTSATDPPASSTFYYSLSQLGTKKRCAQLKRLG